MSEITVHNHKMIFGWEEDNGLGERLIQQILRGRKRLLVHPKKNIPRKNCSKHTSRSEKLSPSMTSMAIPDAM